MKTLQEALGTLPTYGADTVKVVPLVGHYTDGTTPVYLEVHGEHSEQPHHMSKALLPAAVKVRYRWFEVPSRDVRTISLYGSTQDVWDRLVSLSSSWWMHEAEVV